MLKITKIPIILLTALTCVGILVNFIDNFLIITAWWVFVILLCAFSAIWAGYACRKKKLASVDAITSGILVWIVPGSVGLFISGIKIFINSLLWGALEGYEALAFFGGLVIIIILLVVGSLFFGIFGYIGRSISGLQSKK